MKSSNFFQNINYLKYQRNIFAALSFILSLSLFLCVVFLFLKTERVVVAPLKMEDSIWVEGRRISASYVEQQGLLMANLLMSKNPHSVSDQNAIVLRYTSSLFYPELKEKLEEEEAKIKEQGTSFVFYPLETKVDQDKMAIIILGDRDIYLSGKRVSSSREKISMRFSYGSNKPLLEELKIEEISE